MTNQRHAYLIIAHQNENQLCTLLSLLDDARNDIFLCLDKKSNQISEKRVRSCCAESSVSVIRRLVQWGRLSEN